MVSTFTTARNLEKPAAGDQVGTWGTASINPDLDVIDAGMGQTATISAAAGSIVLSATQFRCAQITVNSTLLASITLTFPTSFTGPYTVYHGATGSSAFVITLTTTAAGGQAICCRPGEASDIFNDGTNIRFRNLPPVGTFVDYAGSSMPNWVTGCSVPPFLNCDGSGFSGTTYPALAGQIGTTLPDCRGRTRAALNQGTARLVSSAGVDGNTNFSAGGSATILTSAHVPPVPVTVTDLGHQHLMFNLDSTGSNPVTPSQYCTYSGNGGGDGSYAINGTANVATNGLTRTSTTGITVAAGSSNSTTYTNVQPTIAAGITMIRAG